ncbi:MAG: stage III sporulation AC/AD family protein [Clostridia bacterium]|nr:stage III sporulation AC/AD family protein [Clostridia bacterium]
MNGLLKTCGAALLAVSAGLFLKERHRDLSAIVSVCAGVLIVSGATGAVEQIIGFIREVSSGCSVSEYVPALLKAAGFTILTEVSVGLCKATGEEGLARAVGFAGRCEIILISLPYVRELVGIALGMLNR